MAEVMKTITNWLKETCSARKEPQVFGADNWGTGLDHSLAISHCLALKTA